MATKTQPKIEVDVRPTGTESAIVHAPFDEAYEALTERGYEIISLPENASLRMQDGADSPVSRKYNWVKEGLVYVPGEKPRLVRNSPILGSLETARIATQSHRNGKEFHLTENQVEQALEDSAEFPNSNTNIPTNRFGEEELTVYAFGNGDPKQAQGYGDFLRNAGISEMPVWVAPQDYVKKQDEPFARQMWFGSLDIRSGLFGDLRSLRGAGRLRGVKIGAEGTASEKTSIESYTPKQISESLERLGFSRLEENLLRELKQ